MLRVYFRKDFAIRFIFEDIDGYPVSLKDVPADFWISTRQNGTTFNAYIRDNTSLNAMALDDGSVLVSLVDHHLLPGKMKAMININGTDIVSEARPKPHEHFSPKDEYCHPHHHSNETFRLTPNVPIELVDAPLYHASGPEISMHHPAVVHVRFNLRRPALQKHVTVKELNESIAKAMDKYTMDKFASEEEIQEIMDIFAVGEPDMTPDLTPED